MNLDILYGKLINAVRNNKEYKIKFCDDCKTARISLGVKELNPIIASTLKLLNSNSVKYTNIDLQNKMARYFVVSLTHSKGHKLLTISKPKQNTKTSIQIKTDSINASQVRIVHGIDKEKILIYDTVAAYYSSYGKYYPATVASCCYLSTEIQEVLFSTYSDNNYWKDFIILIMYLLLVLPLFY